MKTNSLVHIIKLPHLLTNLHLVPFLAAIYCVGRGAAGVMLSAVVLDLLLHCQRGAVGPHREAWNCAKNEMAITSLAETTWSKVVASGCRIAGALTLLLLLAIPAVAQAQYTYATNNGTISITGYTGPCGAVGIPSTIHGLPVTSIGNNAFFSCSSLTNITIPNSVTTIGNYAFASCIRLSSIALPASVTSLGDSAFRGCKSLTNVTIPMSVTSIGDNAFYYCNLLLEIVVEAPNPVYSSLDGVLLNKSQTALLQYPGSKAGSYAVPTSVTNIDNRAFGNCANLTSVAIPKSVTRIGDYAFYYCTSLTNVSIPDSVTTIGSYGFYHCLKLASVTIPNTVTSIGDYGFAHCTSLTSVVIPTGVASIGSATFYSCSSLSNVTIPNSVTSIGDYAFDGCANLKAVAFEGNAPRLGTSVFTGSGDGTVFFILGTTGWSATFGGLPTAPWQPQMQLGALPTARWQPQMQTGNSGFGVQTQPFGFNITWASGRSVVVEACTDLDKPVWVPVGTNTLTGGSAHFSDPGWSNYPSRFYRLRSP